VWQVRLVYNRSVSCPLSLSWVQRQAEDALDLARLATKYNRQGLRVVAARLYAAAEESHYRILVAICDLTDTEADFVEPLVTNLEGELYRLTQWVSGITNSDN
jgi:hypothetical protein